MKKSKEIKIQTKVPKDSDFIPPDGGWGWMVILAAGFSNLSILPMMQQFGLLFRDKFARLGINSSETTTIINMNAALTSCVGLLNGPIFKTFTYRQVSLTGAVLIFISLLVTTFAYNFLTYLIAFSILYGAAYGISSSANALALNTYWKERRRLATGLSWTTTGLGPILWPYVIALLFHYYGEFGTVLLLSGFSLHAVACAFLLHPVEWHIKKQVAKVESEENLINNEATGRLQCKKKEEAGYFSSLSKIKNLSAFSSQYLYNEDNPLTPGYEITDPGVPMMLRANDGYFSQSRQSKSKNESKEGSTINSRMNSKKSSMTNLTENRSRKSSTIYLNESMKNSSANIGTYLQDRDNLKPKHRPSISLTVQIPESIIEDCPTLKAPQDLNAEEKSTVENIDPKKAKSIADKAEKQLVKNKSMKSLKIDTQYVDKYNKDNNSNVSLKNFDDLEEKTYLKDNHSNQSQRRKKPNNFNHENEVLKQASLKLEEYIKEKKDVRHAETSKLLPVDESQNLDEKDDKNLTFLQKMYLFFDLDLLKDFTYVNLMLGVTFGGFNELNFSILTPFILRDLGLSISEVTVYMSLLASIDISVRFLVPLIAGRIGWHNNTFFLVGILIMTMGRVVLAHFHTYSVVLFLAVFIGFGKGLRTVFMALVIPTYVPLYKLPGATGIQLLTAGIVYLSLGPVVGYIKDNSSTAVTLYSLNILTWLTAISWSLEKYIRSKKEKTCDQHLIKA